MARLIRALSVGITVAVLLAATAGCGLRSAIDRARPSPTATPSWVGVVRVDGTPIDSYLSKVAEVDARSGRPLSRQIFLGEAPGGDAERNGVVMQPGESVLLTAVHGESPDRFYAVRSFDGLRRGWISETGLAPQFRPK